MRMKLLVIPFLVFASALHAEDKALEKSRQTYEKEVAAAEQACAREIEKSKMKLTKAFDAAIRRATRNGDLKAANTLLAEKKAFAGEGNGENGVMLVRPSPDPILKRIRQLLRFYISAKGVEPISIEGGRPAPFRDEESKKIFWEAYEAVAQMLRILVSPLTSVRPQPMNNDLQ